MLESANSWAYASGAETPVLTRGLRPDVHPLS